ncbi:hypothetical protein HMPREF9056_01944 [Actinomyces sp. oral taxon 170 str. F0386]|nr:hypothetical protein HMPREF9056_01944 [Actinomyces sp. oral taxon 170 str. F0386]
MHGEVLGGGGRAHPHKNTPQPHSRAERGPGMKGTGVQIGDKGT